MKLRRLRNERKFLARKMCSWTRSRREKINTLQCVINYVSTVVKGMQRSLVVVFRMHMQFVQTLDKNLFPWVGTALTSIFQDFWSRHTWHICCFMIYLQTNIFSYTMMTTMCLMGSMISIEIQSWGRDASSKNSRDEDIIPRHIQSHPQC